MVNTRARARNLYSPWARVTVCSSRTSQCAPTARNTSGGRIHPDSCRFDLVPWPLRRHYRRHRLLPVVLPLVQHRAPPCRDRDAHPDDVHHHRAPDVLAQRGRTLQAAWALHPERFVHGTPKPAPLPEAVWINPPATSTTGETSQKIETVDVSKSLTGSEPAGPKPCDKGRLGRLSDLAGRTRVKPEQASKVKMWTPTLLRFGKGRVERGSNRRIAYARRSGGTRCCVGRGCRIVCSWFVRLPGAAPWIASPTV